MNEDKVINEQKLMQMRSSAKNLKLKHKTQAKNSRKKLNLREALSSF